MSKNMRYERLQWGVRRGGRSSEPIEVRIREWTAPDRTQ